MLVAEKRCDPDSCTRQEFRLQDAFMRVHGACVIAADRRHGDDFTFDELDVVILCKDADLTHAVIFGNG
jgi:hypothetical protein